MNAEAKKNRKLSTNIIVIGIVAPIVLASLVGFFVMKNAHTATKAQKSMMANLSTQATILKNHNKILSK